MARLYRTTDDQIVAEGHPDAAYLVVGDSGKVPAKWADAVKEYEQAHAAKPKAATADAAPSKVKRRPVKKS